MRFADRSMATLQICDMLDRGRRTIAVAALMQIKMPLGAV